MKKIVCLLTICVSALVFGDELLKIGGEGKFAIIDTCNAPTSSLAVASKKLGNMLMINVEVAPGTWSLSEAQKSFESTKANAAVFVIKDASLPISLVAMESKWGVVNTEGLSDKSIEKEVLRVSTVVLGGGMSRYTASTMRPVFSPADLENKAGDIVTFDSLMAMANYLPELGIKPFQLMTREDAIEAGIIKSDANVPSAK